MKALRILLVVVALAAAAGFVLWSSREGRDPAVPASSPPPPAPSGGPIAFGILPTTDDRFVPEPCNHVAGGALASIGEFMKVILEAHPGAIGISMGDITQAPGDLGRHTARFHYPEYLPSRGVAFASAGEGELGLGSEFLGTVLGGPAEPQLLCGNATDAAGAPLLRGWALLESAARGVLIVGVAAESLQGEITARGSDVRLLPARAAVDQALADAAAQALRIGRQIDVKVLLVHGTVDEAVAILAEVPGFTFSVAAHGPELAEPEPRRVNGVPVLFAGRGMRFGWRVGLPPRGELDLYLARIGSHLLLKGSSGDKPLDDFRGEMADHLFEASVTAKDGRPRDPRGAYVGEARCQQCHPEQCGGHSSSPHARLQEELLGSDLAASTQCVPCHMTGSWWDTGWRGPKDRSDLAAVSCEACHGPASVHVDDPQPGWGKVSWSRCLECHVPDRSPDFEPEEAWARAGHTRR